MNNENLMETKEKTFEEKMTLLREYVEGANHIAFFGGAGVSTESGIPDFRSKDGLYNQHDVKFEKYKPEYLLSKDCLFHNPKVFYEYYRQKLDCRTINPNATHYFLAKLESEGKRVSIITQNIDGLHQKAGSKEVYEIHGTTMKNICSHCGATFEKDYIFESKESIPKCPHCGRGMVRPMVTLYGEELPDDFVEAMEVLHNADLCIVAGTSLSVYPAANLLQDYYGEHLVIVNRDATDKDKYADLVFYNNLKEVFGNW